MIDARLGGANLFRTNLRNANLVGADLVGTHLGQADLGEADLRDANLREAHLVDARLVGADLRETSLVDADLGEAHLGGANLGGANLVDADLGGADLRWTNLNGAHLGGATLGETIFGDVDLSSCEGLETCRHLGPSIIDIRTLQHSGTLPPAFLRGVGLPENLIEYLPSLLNQAIQMYSCFISYSSKDDDFAQRLHADLQNKGVRCWFAPHDMPIGAKTWDAIDEAIRLRDKLLLILSECSIASDWVEDEVTKAFAEERRRGQLVMFPVRLDDAVLTTAEPWAGKLGDNRHIGDFTRWKEHDTYQKALDRLLRDLRVEKG